MKYLRATQKIGLATILLFSLVNVASSQWGSARAQNTIASLQSFRLLIEVGQAGKQAHLNAYGAKLLEDYGTYQLWQFPAQYRAAAAKLSIPHALTSLSALDTIWLRDGNYIDTASSTGVARQANSTEQKIPAALQQTVSKQPQLWLVQFIGPLKSNWLDTLNELGAKPVAYLPNNAYIIWADAVAIDQINALVASGGVLHWAGPYQPSYRLAPDLRALLSAAGPASDTPSAKATNPTITVQLYTNAKIAQTLAQLGAWAERVQGAAWSLDQYTFLTLQLPAARLADVAQLPDVLDVETWHAPHPNDERQGQIMAGNLIGNQTQPSGPGYLAWLQSQGVPTDPNAYPIVAVVDDGIDNGSTTPLHPDFYQLGNPANPSRIAFAINCTAEAATGVAPESVAGHGNLNAGILGGYNAGTQPFERDAAGYSYGLGIAPFARIANVKTFSNQSVFDISQCDNTYASVVRRAYAAGARISTNSWSSDAASAYNIDAFIYDALTRDADTRTTSSEQMLHIFSAGNRGGSTGKPYSIGSPGVAKNVLTVAASENVRDDGVLDGCNDLDANSAADVAAFSSRGPTNDGRAKPDLIAPGTHIIGPASKSPNYDASGICGAGLGAPDRRYYPAGQITYTWSSGTSHSTPAVAGAAVLAYEFYSRTMAAAAPSPAMLRALLLNSTRYLNGAGANDTLPGIGQGWGAIDLSQLYGSAHSTLDQKVVFSDSGQIYTATGKIADPTRPFRVSLAWTDALGAIAGNAYVNDLDLAVELNGVFYRGNNFAGAYSVPQGQYDSRNNNEQVFLPVGVSGSYVITVTARNIVGNGVPTDLEPTQTGDGTDQDFALVVSNGDKLPQASAQSAREVGVRSYSYAETAPTNSNAAIDPGERVQLTVALANRSVDVLANVVGRISVADQSGNATLISDTVAYGDIAANGIVTSPVPYVLEIAPTQPCVPFQLALDVSYVLAANSEPRQTRLLLQVPMGKQTLGAVQPFTQSFATALAIPDANEVGVRAVLPLSETGTLDDLEIRIDQLNHSKVRDLVVRLIAPSGKSAVLLNRRGQDSAAGVGADLRDLVLDEQATLGLDALTGTGPYSGTYRPDQTLSVFKNEPIVGNWTLLIQDVSASAQGSLAGWGLNVHRRLAECAQVLPTPTPTATSTETATPTATSSPTATATETATPTPTGVPTNTATPTPTATVDLTGVPTATSTSTATPSPTASVTAVPLSTDTPTPSATPSATPIVPADTPTPTATPIVPASATAIVLPTETTPATETPTATAEASPQGAATATPNPTSTHDPTSTPNPTATPNPTSTHDPTSTPNPTSPPA